MTKRNRPSRSLADIIGTPPAPKRGRPVEAHRVRLATAQAQLAEIRGAKLRGELVAAADVERVWTGALSDIRAALLALPSRLGSRFSLPRETVAGIDEEIRTMLRALAASRSVPGADDA